MEPGNGGQTISSSLKIVNLDETPDFEALSYVWGSNIKQKTIICDDTPVQITDTLFEALCRIRHPLERRMVWADAICIDQDKNREKNDQVALMSHIYSRARRVLIHIAGDDEGHAPRVASLVPQVDDMVRTILRDIGPGHRHFPEPDSEAQEKAFKDSRWASLAVLLRQPWFRRGWVIQEAGLARSAIILWGAQTEIDWLALMRCYTWVSSCCSGLAHEIGIMNPRCHQVIYFQRNEDEALAFGHSKRNADILRMFHHARYINFTDHRDRVFAFIGVDTYLCAESGSSAGPTRSIAPINLRPDYTKSTEDTYTDFTSLYLQKRSVDILSYVHHTSHSLSDTHVPSWVPRWYTENFPKTLDTVHYAPLLPEPPPEPSTATHTFYADALNEKTMVVNGVIIDTVEGSPIKWETTEPSDCPVVDIPQIWRAFLSKDCGKSHDLYDLALRLLNTLVIGVHIRDWTATADRYCKFLKRQAEMPKDQQDESVEHLDQWTEHMIHCFCKGQCLLFTSRGYFGNAPHLAQEGDVLCIVFGCRTPFLLRKVGKNTDSGHPLYRLVGQVYIPGAQRKEYQTHKGIGLWYPVLGDERSKDWVEWGLQPQRIHLC